MLTSKGTIWRNGIGGKGGDNGTSYHHYSTCIEMNIPKLYGSNVLLCSMRGHESME